MLASSESESVSTENSSIEPYPSREHIRRMCYFWSEITTGAAVEKEVGEEIGGVEDGGGGFGVEVVASQLEEDFFEHALRVRVAVEVGPGFF